MRPGMPPSSEATDPCAASAPPVLSLAAEETVMDLTIPPDESVTYAKSRRVFGKPLWINQAIQFPLADLQTACEMVRTLVHETAGLMDRHHHMDVSDKVSMCNYRAIGWCARPRTRRSRYTAASDTRGTNPSSTSTVTTGATGSPKDPTRSRSAAAPASCSAAKRSADNEVPPEKGANVPLRSAAVSIAGGQLRPPHASLLA